MKHPVLLIAFLFSFFLLPCVHAEESDLEISESEKYIPVEIKNLEISDDGMFTFASEDWVELVLLIRDHSGQYYGLVKIENQRAPATTWSCPHCGRSNEFWRRVCKHCGKHPHGPG